MTTLAQLKQEINEADRGRTAAAMGAAMMGAAMLLNVHDKEIITHPLTGKPVTRAEYEMERVKNNSKEAVASLKHKIGLK